MIQGKEYLIEGSQESSVKIQKKVQTLAFGISKSNANFILTLGLTHYEG